MSGVEDLLAKMEILETKNEQLQQELDNSKIQNQILESDKHELLGKVSDLESNTKIHGAEPESLVEEEKKLGDETEEIKLSGPERIKEYVVTKMTAWEEFWDREHPFHGFIGMYGGTESEMKEKLSKLDKKFLSHGEDLKKVLNGRLIRVDNDGKTMGMISWNIYEIAEYVSFELEDDHSSNYVVDYDEVSNKIRVLQLIDKNGIFCKLPDLHYHRYKWLGLEDLISKVEFLSIEQEAAARLDLQNGSGIIKLHYQIESISGKPKLVPIPMNPANLRISDYNISLDSDLNIHEINGDGGSVQFEAVLVDQNGDPISKKGQTKMMLRLKIEELETMIQNFEYEELDSNFDIYRKVSPFKYAEEKINSFLENDIDDEELTMKAIEIVTKSSEIRGLYPE